MRRIVAAAAAVSLLTVTVALPAQALVPADVSLTAGPVSTVVSVSPDVYFDEKTGTFYLFTTGMQIGVYKSTDGTAWQVAPGASTPTGPYSDPSVVAMPDGTYRMYYAYRASNTSPCSGKELRYATSPDLVRWTAQPGTLLTDLGCGVPNVVRTGTEYRLYYVRGGPGLPHGTYLATSPDGLAWTPTDELLTPVDFVDPSVVRLADGSWLMLTADFASPPPPEFFQQLYAGTSADGLKWDFGAKEPLFTAPSGKGAFDPDVVVMPDGSVRAWWSQGVASGTALVAAGTVGIASPPLPATPGKPTISASSRGAKVAWTYAAGAPAVEGYVVQVKTTGGWRDVATTTQTSRSLTWSKVGVAKGASFHVRVVAFIGDAEATSPSAKATRPR